MVLYPRIVLDYICEEQIEKYVYSLFNQNTYKNAFKTLVTKYVIFSDICVFWGVLNNFEQ